MMAQKKNTVQLTQTALNRLQKLVDSDEYCSLDDAASHIIVSTLPSTGQYSSVPITNESKPTQIEPSTVSTLPQVATNGAKSSPPPRTRITGLD